MNESDTVLSHSEFYSKVRQNQVGAVQANRILVISELSYLDVNQK